MMRRPGPRHDRRSRPTRRPAERSDYGGVGRQGRLHRSLDGGRLSGRSKSVRSSARSGSRRWPTRRTSLRGFQKSTGRAIQRSCRTWQGSSAPMQPGVTDVAIFAAASETFSRRNINKSIDESLGRLPRRLRAARGSFGFRCARISPPRSAARSRATSTLAVARIAAALIDMGAFEVSVSDTIGIAHPGQVPTVVGAVADACRSRRSRCTFTTRGGPRSPTSWRRSISASRLSMRLPAGSADVPMRRGRPATSPPKISCTCSMAWASGRESIWTAVMDATDSCRARVGHSPASTVFRCGACLARIHSSRRSSLQQLMTRSAGTRARRACAMA